MRSIEQQIPLFPSKLVPNNQDAIDFSPCDIAVVGCGTTINFSYVQNFQLLPGYSITIGSNTVTSLRFHQTMDLLIIGDSKGYIYIFDYQKRTFCSRPFLLNENASVLQIEFRGDDILVLYKNNVLAFLKYYSKSHPRFYTFSCIWKITVPADSTSFCIDPYKQTRIFVYAKNSNFFIVYQIKDSKRPPKAITEPLSLSNKSLIQNAQFSIHLRNYIYLITESSIMLYSLEFNVVVSISHYQKTSSSLDNIVQLQNDHTKLLCFHKSGTISIFTVNEPFNLISTAEISHTIQSQSLFSYKLSPIRDDYLICVYDPIGVALLDLSTFKIVSIVPFWSDSTTSFATNGTHYAIGTNKGYVVSGHLFNYDEKSCFKISEKPITFVSLVPSKNLIYWATAGSLGVVDSGIRKVTLFPEHSLLSQRAVCSPDGGLMVQRESCVLGLFIDGKEVCIPTGAPIIDFCFNDENSGFSSGSMMLLIENGVLLFFDYSRAHGVSQPFLKRVLETNYGITCSAWRGIRFAVGFIDGTITVMQTTTLEMYRVEVRTSPIVKVQFCESELFGLTEDGYLFVVREQKAVICGMSSIKHFSVVNSSLISVIGADDSINFLRRSDFENLSSISKAMPIPDVSSFSARFIENNPIFSNGNPALSIPQVFKRDASSKADCRRVVYGSQDGRDFWLHILKKSSLRLMEICAVGKSLQYESTLADIFSLLENNDKVRRDAILDAFLFAHRIEAANTLLSKADPSDSSSFMLSSIFATAMISFDEEVTDEQLARIKPAGISLIMNHRTREGAQLLRVAKLDKVAVEYLIQSNHLYEAMRFIRSSLQSNDKKRACFEIALKLTEKKRYREAMLLFLTAGEMHPALYCLYKLRRIDDAYIIKAYLKQKGLLVELDHSKALNIINLLPLKRLCLNIDVQFSSSLEKRGLDPKEYELSNRPRTFSTP